MAQGGTIAQRITDLIGATYNTEATYEGDLINAAINEIADMLPDDVLLKYSSIGDPAICQIHRVSKPGKRIYSSINSLPGYFNNMGIHVLSTSQGVMSDREAKKRNIGGEVICKVF